MMLENKIYSMLSLCQRAGKLYSGGYSCDKTIKSGKAQLVIIAKDTGENSKKQFIDICRNNNVRVYLFGTKENLGKYIGKGDKTIVCITDINFKKS